VTADQTANISAAKGGAIVVKAASVAVGSLLRALTSAAVVILDAVDGAFPQLFAPGVALENNPGFGAPQIRGNDTSSSLYVSANGNGPLRGGTGIGMMQDNGTPANSFVEISLNDNPRLVVIDDGVFPEPTVSPEESLGGPGLSPQFQSWLSMWSQVYATRVGPNIVAADTISPTFGIHPLSGHDNAIHTINLPVLDFTGTIQFLSDEAMEFSAVGPSNIHQAFTMTPGIPAYATFDGAEWWLK
jgi:hypothetical protein